MTDRETIGGEGNGVRPPLFKHVLFGRAPSNKSRLLTCGIKCVA